MAFPARSMVRALLDLGEMDEALEVGERVYRLCRDESKVHRDAAVLAYGMALAARDPQAGLPVLEEAYEGYRKPLLGYRLAQAALHLSRARLRLGDREGARAALEGARPGLEELAETGIRLLAGAPEEFSEVLSLVDQPCAAVELCLLGRCEARVAGRYVRLEPRQAEILALLALHPKGLTCRDLAARIYGRDAAADISARENALKVAIYHLREVFPLASRPYRIAVPVRADFLEIEHLIEQGETTQAIALYQGPLLPRSEAREIEQLRWALEAKVQRAALASGDAEVLLALSERVRDDQGLWEAAVKVLPAGDPRRLVAQTRIRRLRRGV